MSIPALYLLIPREHEALRASFWIGVQVGEGPVPPVPPPCFPSPYGEHKLFPQDPPPTPARSDPLSFPSDPNPLLNFIAPPLACFSSPYALAQIFLKLQIDARVGEF